LLHDEATVRERVGLPSSRTSEKVGLPILETVPG
jgi:hypothetical protein